jgi:hypothetical protein
MSKETQGTRIYPDEKGWLKFDEMFKLATYGRATAVDPTGRSGWWQVTCPDGSGGSLNPDIHTIVEHEDGTITVSPSIDMSQRSPEKWHGFLKSGVFISCKD